MTLLDPGSYKRSVIPEFLKDRKRLIAVGCALLCAGLTGWYCARYQWTIRREAEKHGIDTTQRTLTRVSLSADADAAVSHGVWGRGVAEGQMLPSHITVYEHRDRIIPYPVAPRLMSGTLFLLIGNVDTTYNVAVILGPMAAALMAFFLFYRLTGSSWFASAFSLGTVIMARMPAQLAKDAAALLKLEYGDFHQVWGYLYDPARIDEMFISRLEAPALTYFAYAGCLYLILSRQGLKKASAWWVVGAAAGVLSMFSLFHFLYASILCGLLLLFHLVTEPKYGLRASLFGAAGYAGAVLPFMAMLIYGMAQHWYPDIEARTHIEEGRTWRSSLNGEYLWAVIFASISLLAYWRLKIERREYFLWAAACFLVRPIFFNLQLIFGSIPEPDHIERYGTNMGEWLGILLFAYAMAMWIKGVTGPAFLGKFRRFVPHLRWALYGIPLLAFVSAAVWITHAPVSKGQRVWERFVRPVGEDAMLRWIDANTVEDAAFLTTDFEAGLRVVAATGRYLFVAPANTTLTNAEIERRLILAFSILGLDGDDLYDTLEDRETKFAIRIYGNLYLPRYQDSSFTARATDRKIPEEKHQELRRQLESTPFDPTGKETFVGETRLDYILLSPRDLKMVDAEAVERQFGLPVYAGQGYLIFRY